MKERRKAGATHSFRLTMEASAIVDNLNHPRSLGGKSRLISDAITYYFQESKHTSIPELLAGRKFWMDKYEDLAAKKPESAPQVPAWWRRILRSISQWRIW